MKKKLIMSFLYKKLNYIKFNYINIDIIMLK